MKAIIILVFSTLVSTAFAQQRYKPIQVVEYNAIVSVNDTNVLYIKRIDTLNFRKLINNGNKIAVQLWQPWCSGIVDLMPKLVRLKDHLEGRGYQFLLISDRKEGLDYFKITDAKVGKVAYFFNKYQINFETYQVAIGEDLDDYKRIISDVTREKVNYNFFCFLLNKGNLEFQSYSQQFYKKNFK